MLSRIFSFKVRDFLLENYYYNNNNDNFLLRMSNKVRVLLKYIKKKFQYTVMKESLIIEYKIKVFVK